MNDVIKICSFTTSWKGATSMWSVLS